MSQTEASGSSAEAEETETIIGPRPIIPSDLAPTMFIDGLEGFVFNDHVVKFNAFETVIVRVSDNATAVQQRTLAHIVVTHTVLDQIVEWLGENIARKAEQAARAAASRAEIERREELGASDDTK